MGPAEIPVQISISRQANQSRARKEADECGKHHPTRRQRYGIRSPNNRQSTSGAVLDAKRLDWRTAFRAHPADIPRQIIPALPAHILRWSPPSKGKVATFRYEISDEHGYRNADQSRDGNRHIHADEENKREPEDKPSNHKKHESSCDGGSNFRVTRYAILASLFIAISQIASPDDLHQSQPNCLQIRRFRAAG